MKIVIDIPEGLFEAYKGKSPRYARRMSMPLTRTGELIDALEELTGDGYVMFYPQYCPMCGKKIEEAENE